MYIPPITTDKLELLKLIVVADIMWFLFFYLMLSKTLKVINNAFTKFHKDTKY